MVRGRSSYSRRLWLLAAISLAVGAAEAVRAVDPSQSPNGSGAQPAPAPPRWADRLRRWLVGPRSSRAGQPETRHFDAFEFWALERDERRRR